MNRRYSAYLVTSLVIIVLLAPVVARGGSGFDSVAERALNCGVSPESVAQARKFSGDSVPDNEAVALLAPLLAACVEQLPVGPLEDKLAEGVAKNVASQFIVRALEKRLDGYRFARELLLTTTGRLDQKIIVIVGEGLDNGVPSANFEAYASTYGKQPSDAFHTGITMVSLQGQAGFDFGLTNTIVAQGFESGTLSSDWRFFVRVILAARERGIADAAIAQAATAVLVDGGPVSSVMPQLGFTGRDLGGDE